MNKSDYYAPNRPEPDPTGPFAKGGTRPNGPDLANLYLFGQAHSIPNCTVITFDGIDGFMWIDPDGVRHNEGLRWPTMRIEQNCTVEVLTDEYGRESKGWYKDGQ